MDAAEKCRENGWGVGTRLTGNEEGENTVIEITAVGEIYVLAKAISCNGVPVPHPSECNWMLACRNWRRVPDTPDQKRTLE